MQKYVEDAVILYPTQNLLSVSVRSDVLGSLYLQMVSHINRKQLYQ